MAAAAASPACASEVAGQAVSSGSMATSADDAHEAEVTPTSECEADSEGFADAQETAVEIDPIEECVSFCPPAKSSDAKPSALEDPALEPPAQSKADWAAEMKALSELVDDESVSDDEKIKLLHEALLSRIEDTRGQESHGSMMARRLEEAAKERDRCRIEGQRAIHARTKLEADCRQLQTQKSTIAKENQKIAEEEQSRYTELKDKFQQAIKDVQEKMDAELEVRQHFLKENEELRGKLHKFTETYEEQERQLAEQRESRAREMTVAQERLKEHEVMCSESKAKTAGLEKHNVELRKSQTVLRAELQTILGKFDEFHEAVTGSNERHGACKTEIDAVQSELQELEKENAELKESKELTEMQEAQKTARKQRDTLDKLCDNLAKENRKLQEQLKKLQRNR